MLKRGSLVGSVGEEDQMSFTEKLKQTHLAAAAAAEQGSGTNWTKKAVNGQRSIVTESQDAFPALKSGIAAPSKKIWGPLGRVGQQQQQSVRQQSSPTIAVSEPSSSRTSTPGSVKGIRSSHTSEIVTFDPADLAKDKSLAAIAKRIGAKHDVAIDVSRSGRTGQVDVLFSGKTGNIPVARRELTKEIALKRTKLISAPSHLRSLIIGTRGRTLNAIVEASGARINVPKQDEEVIDITVEGDAAAVDTASKLIQQIIDERMSQVTVVMNDVPVDFHTLISGPFQRKVEAWEKEDVKIRSNAEDGSFTLAGEKDVVARVEAEILQQYAALQTSTISAAIQVPRSQHRFVIGDQRKTEYEILETTGCAIILPTTSASLDTITIRGSPADLGRGIAMAMEKANSVTLAQIDIDPADTHLAQCLRYLRRIEYFSQLETTYHVSVLMHTDRVEISAADKTQAQQAKSALFNRLQALTPDKFATVTADPLIHRYIIGTKNRGLNKIYEQFSTLCFFRDDSDQVLLVLDGSNNLADLNGAKGHVENVVAENDKLSTVKLPIDRKFHPIITGPKGTTLNALIGDDSIVRIIMNTNIDEVMVRGLPKETDRVVREIQSLLAEVKDDDLGPQLLAVTVDFPEKFSRNLIGKGGSNIEKLRDSLGVRVNLEGSKVEISGVKKNVQVAQKRLLDLRTRLEDDTILRLSIPNEHHNVLIGQNGKVVRRLTERYDVRVLFYRDGGDDDAVDSPRNPNEVVVRGASKQAKAAADELTALSKYEQEHSYSESVAVPVKALSRIVGRNGNAITQLSEDTHTRINVEQVDDSASVIIQGTKSGVQSARTSILQIAREVEDNAERTINIDRQYHRNLIGPGGSVLQDTIIQAGGSTDKSLHARMVRFPKDGDEILVRGNTAVVEKIINAFLTSVKDLESRITMTIDIPSSKVRSIIGAGGNIRRNIEDKHSVTVNIPRSVGEKESETITVSGQPDNVQAAKAAILV